MLFFKFNLLTWVTVLLIPLAHGAADPDLHLYSEKVQPLLNNRCLACHSCFNAPCQFNLQNHEGFSRGANKHNVYDGTRIESVEPTRIWIDAHTPEEWSKKSFFSVNTSFQTADSVFFQMLLLRSSHPELQITQQVHQSNVCPASMREFKALERKTPQLGMPYGLPALDNDQLTILKTWVEKGAPGPSAEEIASFNLVPEKVQKQITTWEKFFNEESPRQKLVSRYLFEHLFLSHIYFADDKNLFFRLVRSHKACSEGLAEIPTRRPNDDPGKDFFYCLQKYPGSVVMKIHMPYEWSNEKLARIKEIFFHKEWQPSTLPGYSNDIAGNPFLTFRDIPAEARYQFLLEDAQYEISTFIKGPVCNGSMAVNSIQEQFYVLFLKPQADNMVLSSAYEAKANPLLMLPGEWGSDIGVLDTPLFFKKLVDRRENYRRLRTEEFRKLRPNGYSLEDIWNGDGINDNALLTIFRHDQNAVVMKGAVGDLPKTLFVLDYPLFERLVYDLVVNFDVFGNVGHQLLTRVYMDMIRMEAEELFLQFLPPSQRLAYRKDWYKGALAEAKLRYIFPDVSSSEPTAIKYGDKGSSKQQFVEKVLFERLDAKVRGPLDGLNWKNFAIPQKLKSQVLLDSDETRLRKIVSIKADPSTPFARFFPDIAYLILRKADKKRRVFSVIHNKEHENVSWILSESLRMAPEEDTLTLKEGFWGSYPNIIFQVLDSELADFVKQTSAVKSADDYQALVGKYGVRRQNPQFWSFYDELNQEFRETHPTDFGYLDLTRYDLL